MNLPPFGLYLPVKSWRVIDGDTVEVQLPGAEWRWHIRLIDCYAAELRTPEGRQAARMAAGALENADYVAVYVPAPEKVGDLLYQLTTLGRLLGHLFLGSDDTLSALLVRTGHATATRPAHA